MLLAEFVGGFGDAFELRFALEVQQNGGFFDEAALQYALDDFVAVEGFFGFTQYISNDV